MEKLSNLGQTKQDKINNQIIYELIRAKIIQTQINNSIKNAKF